MRELPGQALGRSSPRKTGSAWLLLAPSSTGAPGCQGPSRERGGACAATWLQPPPTPLSCCRDRWSGGGSGHRGPGRALGTQREAEDWPQGLHLGTTQVGRARLWGLQGGFARTVPGEGRLQDSSCLPELLGLPFAWGTHGGCHLWDRAGPQHPPQGWLQPLAAPSKTHPEGQALHLHPETPGNRVTSTSRDPDTRSSVPTFPFQRPPCGPPPALGMQSLWGAPQQNRTVFVSHPTKGLAYRPNITPALGDRT